MKKPNVSRFSTKKQETNHEKSNNVEDDYLTMTVFDEAKRTERRENCPPKSETLKWTEEVPVQRGIDTPIPEDNKGYKLLKKFGYDGTGGLGKSEVGREQPIEVAGQRGTRGLGIDAEAKARVLETKRKRELKTSDLDNAEETYLQYQKTYNEFRHIRRTAGLIKSIIVDLDERAGNPSDHSMQETEEEVNLSSYDQLTETLHTATVNLENNLLYLREKYSYCYFCGCQYSSPEDMKSNCPGVLEIDHC